MSPSVTSYPQPGKDKSRLVLEAFAAGCGGTLSSAAVLRPGPAAFWGVVGIEALFRAARQSGRDWYYGDNSFLDVSRGTHFRFARNAFQDATRVKPDMARLAALGVQIRPWHRGGNHVVVVESSEHFLRLTGRGAWLAETLAELRRYTERPIVLRRWRSDKGKASATLAADLVGAWALVTHMSAAANEALLAGVPVFVTGSCAATPLASGPLSEIDRPSYPDGRKAWAAGLAANQWTLEEIRCGMAWRELGN